jgi:putative transposase
MKQTKCVWQFHDKNDALKEVFDYFRFCTNEMIRISEQKNLTSRGAMHNEFYKNLRRDFIAKYIQSATSVAKARLKLYRTTKKKKPNAKIPYVKRNIIILDNQSFKIQDNILQIPIKPYEYIFIKLYSYVIKQLEDTKVGSITLTPEKLIISYSKEILQINPEHHVGIDRNFNNATSFDTTGKFMVYNLEKTNQIKTVYKEVKSKFKRNDVRIKKKIYSKYGKKEKIEYIN